MFYVLNVKNLAFSMPDASALRAFPSKLSKNLAFNISKSHLINFNNLFYNTPNIKAVVEPLED